MRVYSLLLVFHLVIGARLSAQGNLPYFENNFRQSEMREYAPDNALIQAIPFDSSTLPIVYIKTNWQLIPDEPKIMADMWIIDNGYNQVNHVNDPPTDYNGKIGIERRGNISQLWPQKNYSVETRTADSLPLDTFVLGMPQDNDWVLYGPYDDRTLMKNVMTYELARQMGYWAPRCRYVELVINTWGWPEYKGVYVMMEKIKRDNNRVDIAKLDNDDNAGDSLTGGYIIAIDSNFWSGELGFNSTQPQGLWFSYKYPDGDTITPQQEAYIKAYIDSFELSLLQPNFQDLQNGFRKFCYEHTFQDYFIFQELSKNIDAFKRSNYFYKDKHSKGGKLHNMPFWDYNSAWGITACALEEDTGWVYNTWCWPSMGPIPFWYSRMLQDSIYLRDLKCRWITWRSTVLDTANIFTIIDSLAAYLAVPSQRQYAQYNFSETFAGQVDTLKMFIRKRIAWLDANLPGNCWNLGLSENASFGDMFSVYPNPASGEVSLSFYLGSEKKLTIELYSTLGEKVKTLGGQEFQAGSNTVSFDVSRIPPGVYFMQVSDGVTSFGKKLVIAD